jgi:hypothetical protein
VKSLKNLIESMPRNLEDIIRREGNPTKYHQRSSTPNELFSGPKSFN